MSILRRVAGALVAVTVVVLGGVLWEHTRAATLIASAGPARRPGAALRTHPPLIQRAPFRDVLINDGPSLSRVWDVAHTLIWEAAIAALVIAIDLAVRRHRAARRRSR